MIYTSYYSKVKSLDPNVNAFVCVSNSKPSWFPPCYRLEEVYPGWDLVNAWKQGLISWDEYTESYMKILEDVDKNRIQRILNKLSKRYTNVFLLCWESLGPCHRYSLADWLDMGIIEY